MKLDEMELLVRVAETGSMTLAARQMHLTPAAVSAAVRRVEETMGVRLFERTTRSLHPTDEGLVVLEGCQDVVERWERTLEEVHGTTHELVGTVHLSAPADTTYQVLAPVIVAVAEAHPRLQVVVHSSDALQHLQRDAIDMAIRYGAMPDSSLSARKLAESPGVLVAAPAYLARRGHPRAPEQLAGHRCLTLQLASVAVTRWTLHGEGSVHEVSLGSPLCGDGHLARMWAVAGMGIALKSLFDVIDDLEAGRLVRVLPGYASSPTPYHAVFPSRRYLPARVRALDVALTSEFTARHARCEAWLRRTAPSADA
ncbi:LysR family transcriptional regulator [Enhygromyxa salina]|uniref:HTH-type transcriptional regulator DmlR n=1 Tax=Enhygromyxa salina TaxID=215803 RepID=A0A2S9YVM7_9BACT|nr:LysR family transcriptional regulator [Enhygromyxa salina]PRQ09099.1 HTH-type transcriptional regulator DmlR [Enhygromyxa salina]